MKLISKISFIIVIISSCNNKSRTFTLDDFNTTKDLALIEEQFFSEVAYTNLYSIDQNTMLARLVNSDYNFAVLDDNLKVKAYLFPSNIDNDNIPLYFDVIDVKSFDEIIRLTLNDYNSNEILNFEIDIVNNFDVNLIDKINYYPIQNLQQLYPIETGYIGNVNNLDTQMDYVRLYDSDFNIKKTIPLPLKSSSQDLEHILYYHNTTFSNYFEKIDDNQFLLCLPSLQEITILDTQLNMIQQLKTPFSDNEIENIIKQKNSQKNEFFHKPILYNELITLPFIAKKGSKITSLLFFDRTLNSKFKVDLNHAMYSMQFNYDKSKLYVIDFKEETVYTYNTESLE